MTILRSKLSKAEHRLTDIQRRFEQQLESHRDLHDGRFETRIRYQEKVKVRARNRFALAPIHTDQVGLSPVRQSTHCECGFPHDLGQGPAEHWASSRKLMQDQVPLPPV